MRERTTLNPMDLTSDQLLTGKEMMEEQIPPEMVRVPDQKGFTIPDLHNTGEKPTTAGQRKDIEKNLGTADLKDQILEEKIKNDIENAKKSKGSKIDTTKTPKEVLKTLIARGDYQETVELYGANWTLRALDYRDMIITFDSMKDDITTQVGRLTVLMYSQILSAIEAINGYPLTEWFDEVKISDFSSKEAYLLGVRAALKSYMDHLPSIVIDDLYSEYRKIEEKRNAALNDLKN